MVNCLRCKHPLTNPVSIRRGYGPVCASALVVGDAEQQSFDLVDLPFDPYRGDIVCQRDARGYARFNIPQRVIRHSPTGMEWGYSGSGPSDLALNILTLFTSLDVASSCYQEFKAEFVATLPHAGGVIRGGDVREWLRARYADGEYYAGFVPEFEAVMP